MTHDEAVALLSGAVTTRGETWADLGAGTGTFSRALASLLGNGGVVYAVDSDAAALHELERLARRTRAGTAEIRTLVADFTSGIALPEMDGIVIANALHFVPYERQADVLGRIARMAKRGGPIVVVEYERRGPNRWVPYPVSFRALDGVARTAGLVEPALLATQPSRYSGSIYSSVVRRPAP